MRRVVLVLLLSAWVALGAVQSSVSASTRSFGLVMQAEYGMAIDGRSGLVVVNRSGIFRTIDDGTSWEDITPRSLRGLLSHVANVIAIGPRIWLEMEGDDRFGFVPFSRDGGRIWRVATIAGSVQLSSLVFTDQRDGWVTDTTSGFKQFRYKTTDGGVSWQRAARAPEIRVPSSVSGIRISTDGVAPMGLKLRDAVQSPGGRGWAQATGPAIIGPTVGSYYPTYLLESENDGRSWATVFPAIATGTARAHGRTADRLPALARVDCGSGVVGAGFTVYGCSSGGARTNYPHPAELLVVRTDGSYSAYRDTLSQPNLVKKSATGEIVAAHNNSVVRVTASAVTTLVDERRLDQLFPGSPGLGSINGLTVNSSGDIFLRLNYYAGNRDGCGNVRAELTAARRLKVLWRSAAGLTCG